MSLTDFIKLILRNFKWLIVLPILAAIIVVVLTTNTPQKYSSGALVYTGIASGYNIEAGIGERSDYHAINNAFDNLITIIKSRYITEEVSLNLLALHLVQKGPVYGILNQETFSLLQELLPVVWRNKHVVTSNQDATYANIKSAFVAGDPLLTRLIKDKSTYYSLKQLNTLEVKRHKGSDMLALYYVSNDPGVTVHTLNIYLEVFSKKYSQIKESETGDVVAYFEKELQKAKEMLDDAENRLTIFRKSSKIINYGEQTKAIAIKMENALEDFSSMKMNMLSSEAALKEIEAKLQIREHLLVKNTKLLQLRDKLIKQNFELAIAEAGDSTANPQTLLQEIESTTMQIKVATEEAFSLANTKEGLPNKQLLNEWLSYIITLSMEKAKVEFYSQRLADIHAQYNHFAPLGSVLARMEREIGVHEKAYLQILQGLNESKIRQQSIQMKSKLEIVDTPSMPASPLSSGRILIVVATASGVFISVFSWMILAALLDRSIRNPERAESIFGIKPIAILPNFNQQIIKLNEGITNKLMGLLVGKLQLYHYNEKPRLMVVFSAINGEGKSLFIEKLIQTLPEKCRFALVAPDHTPLSDNVKNKISYTLDHKLLSLENVEGLVGNELYKNLDLIIMEMPDFSSGILPINIMKQSDDALMVVRADTSWSPVHQKTVEFWNNSIGCAPEMILNGVDEAELDNIIGELPKKRNATRKLFKKLLKFEFSPATF